ncbi:MAG TPA: hypothetical protein PLD40_10485, partial [Kiritimatiellia bacterium]|nr:hypothetical protein [Kiritimatiellia bacterium]
MEKYFPHCGKSGQKSSTLWKSWARFFHTMEKVSEIFPHNGTTLREFFHTVEKWGQKVPRNGKTFGDFSTQWKIGECRARARRAMGERELYSDRCSRASQRAIASAAANFGADFPHCGKGGSSGDFLSLKEGDA